MSKTVSKKVPGTCHFCNKYVPGEVLTRVVKRDYVLIMFCASLMKGWITRARAPKVYADNLRLRKRVCKRHFTDAASFIGKKTVEICKCRLPHGLFSASGEAVGQVLECLRPFQAFLDGSRELTAFIISSYYDTFGDGELGSEYTIAGQLANVRSPCAAVKVHSKGISLPNTCDSAQSLKDLLVPTYGCRRKRKTAEELDLQEAEFTDGEMQNMREEEVQPAMNDQLRKDSFLGCDPHESEWSRPTYDDEQPGSCSELITDALSNGAVLQQSLSSICDPICDLDSTDRAQPQNRIFIQNAKLMALLRFCPACGEKTQTVHTPQGSQVPSVVECHLCVGVVPYTLDNLYTHLERFHGCNKIDIDTLRKSHQPASEELRCQKCDLVYFTTNIRTRQRILDVQPEVPQNRHLPISCPCCKRSFYSNYDLARHCQSAHSDDGNFCFLRSQFNSWEEFKLWLHEKERDTFSKMVLKRVGGCKRGIIYFYSCHRSGEGVGHGQQAVNNSNIRHCPCCLKALIRSDKVVEVTACFTHYGHAVNPPSLESPTANDDVLKKEMANGQLLSGDIVAVKNVINLDERKMAIKEEVEDFEGFNASTSCTVEASGHSVLHSDDFVGMPVAAAVLLEESTMFEGYPANDVLFDNREDVKKIHPLEKNSDETPLSCQSCVKLREKVSLLEAAVLKLSDEIAELKGPPTAENNE